MTDDNVWIKVGEGAESFQVKASRDIINSDYINGPGIENALSQIIRAHRNIKNYQKNETQSGNESILPEDYKTHQSYAIEIPEFVETDHLEESVDENELLKEIKNTEIGREIEFVLLLCYLASRLKGGKFSREDLIKLYEDSERATLSRKRNLSNNLQTLSKYNYIGGQNPNYFMTKEGIYRAKGILSRKKPLEKRYN
jgi:hypothetical protein